MSRLGNWCLPIALTPFAVLAWSPQAVPAKNQPTFENDVKPILTAHCASCHSGNTIRAGLDVTKVVSVRAKAKSGVLIDRLLGRDGRPVMPLGFKPLDPAQIKIITAWARSGMVEGVKKTHWAYLPIRKPIPPAGTPNPIDAFVLERLRQEGLAPAKPAAPETLLRRASLDLTGLPPTLDELDRKETYEQSLDRLLASSHYGERMAAAWLDLARYADTNGYEKDGARTAWKYRDWVVDAFNRNMPYDQFTIEQLAGDLLPQPSIDQRIATGFNRNTMLNLEGGVDQEEAIHEVRNDRVATTSVVWLGQTLACARCHDHKYDPLSQKDYYRFYAFFANNKFDKVGDSSISEQKYIEPSIPAGTAAQLQQLQALSDQAKQAETQWAAKKDAVAQELAEWQKSRASHQWLPVEIKTTDSNLAVSGNEVTAIGPIPDRVTYELTVTLLPGTRSLRLEALPDPTRPNNGPGNASNGNFVLSRVAVSGAKIVDAVTDYIQPEYTIDGLLDDDVETGWGINNRTGKRHEIGLALDREMSGPVTVTVECGSVLWPKHTLAHFAISASTKENGYLNVVPEVVEAALAANAPTEKDQKVVSDWFSTVAKSNRSERIAMRAARREHDRLKSTLPTAMVMVEADRKLEAPIRHRGEFLSPEKVVPSGTPAALGPIATGNRLTLAKWLVSPKNPLSARVQVNRLWEMLFGKGLVETSENFGTQGTKPTHAALLDWLAATYIESGWDTKRMLRLIMTSNTYRQSSVATALQLKKDPTNALLSRGPRFRLPAEAVRDTALVSAGLLNPAMGGPPVYPYQPDGVWDSPYSGEKWMPSKGADRYRRAIYTFWKRTAPYPSFVAFDATSREACTVRRSRTNTPLQALALLNDPGRFEAARALGNRFRSSYSPIPDRLANAFRAVTSRKPSKAEVAALERFLNRAQSKNANLPNSNEIAWGLVGNVLLNLDEAMTKE